MASSRFSSSARFHSLMSVMAVRKLDVPPLPSTRVGRLSSCAMNLRPSRATSRISLITPCGPFPSRQRRM